MAGAFAGHASITRRGGPSLRWSDLSPGALGSASLQFAPGVMPSYPGEPWLMGLASAAAVVV